MYCQTFLGKMAKSETYLKQRGFPVDSEGKESACNAGNPGSIPGSGGYPGEGNGNPLQYCCLENSMDRGTWQATVLGVVKSQIQLSDLHFHFHLKQTPSYKIHMLNVKNRFIDNTHAYYH